MLVFFFCLSFFFWKPHWFYKGTSAKHLFYLVQRSVRPALFAWSFWKSLSLPALWKLARLLWTLSAEADSWSNNFLSSAASFKGEAPDRRRSVFKNKIWHADASFEWYGRMFWGFSFSLTLKAVKDFRFLVKNKLNIFLPDCFLFYFYLLTSISSLFRSLLVLRDHLQATAASMSLQQFPCC